MHELRPSLLLTKPEVATQGTQVAAAAPDTSPTGQVVHAPALGPLKVPGSQIVHASAPSGANVPPSHSWQVDAPSPAYVPAAQFDAHSDEPAELRMGELVLFAVWFLRALLPELASRAVLARIQGRSALLAALALGTGSSACG